MFEQIFGNWKTTLGGILTGIVQWSLLTPGDFTWRGFGAALPTFILGALSSDKKRP